MGWFCRPFLSALPFWQQDHYLFFCAWRTGGVLPTPYKMTSSMPTLCIFLSLMETDATTTAWGCDICARGAVQPGGPLPKNTRHWRSGESRIVHMWQMWGRLEIHVLLSAPSSSRTSLAMVWRGTALHMLPEVPWLLLLGWDTIIKPYAGELWVILVHGNAWTQSWCYRHLSVPQNPIKGLCDIMYCSI